MEWNILFALAGSVIVHIISTFHINKYLMNIYPYLRRVGGSARVEIENLICTLILGETKGGSLKARERTE